MSTIISIREEIILFLKKYEYFLVFAIKFFLGFWLFRAIAGIGLFDERFTSFLNDPVVMLCSIVFGVLFTFMPLSVLYLLVIMLVTAALSSSLEVAFIVFIFLLLVLIFYARLAPRESVLILAMIAGFYFKIPYLVPIFAGLYFGITSAIPVIIGIFIWRMAPFTFEMAATTGSTITELSQLMDIPKTLYEVYSSYTDLININQLWVFESLIFSMVVVLVYFISRLNFDYSKLVSSVMGGILNIVGFAIAVFVTDLDVSVSYIILSTALCVLLALAITFFDNVLDYPCAEKVEFEDDDFYYYVRVIPKIKGEKEKAEASKKAVKKKPTPKPTAEPARTAKKVKTTKKKKTEAEEIKDPVERSRRLIKEKGIDKNNKNALVRRERKIISVDDLEKKEENIQKE